MGTSAPARRQEERSALSMHMLKEAAVSLLVERGVAGTTLALLGEKAGYSRGQVTHCFGTKMGLFAYVHDTVADEWIVRVKAAVGDHVGIVALHKVVDALYGFIVEVPNHIRAMYLLRYSSIDPGADFRANVAKVHRAQRRDVRRWIEGGQSNGDIDSRIDANLAAEAFCSLIDGMLYRWFVDPSLPVRELHQLVRSETKRCLSPAD